MMSKWQNLLNNRCPYCSATLLDLRLYLECPTRDIRLLLERRKSHFFISKKRVVEILSNSNSPAYYRLSKEDKAKVPQFIKTLNVI